ncbi:MAG: HAMP domain-containing protein [Acidobacteria bacterium]|nr:MAG: HAMP domain-containing protein [Acidobacteriota bacterium]
MKTRMAKLTATAVVLYVLGTAISYFSPNSIFTILEGLGTLGLIITLPYYLVKLVRSVKNRWLWKVRNKIIVSYAFVGIIPMVILVLLLWLTMRLVVGQLAALYLDSELQNVSARLREANQGIALGYYQKAGSGTAEAGRILEDQARTALGQLAGQLGTVSWKVLQPVQAQGSTSGAVQRGGRMLAAIPEVPPSEPVKPIPGWALKGFSGLVYDDGKLYFRSVGPLRSRDTVYFSCLQLPFSQDLINRIQQDTALELSIPVPLHGGEDVDVSFSDFVTGGQINYIGLIVPVNWTTGQVSNQHATALRVPLRTVYDHYFTETQTLGAYLFPVFTFLGSLFVLVELISFVIAVVIARSITRTIHTLDEATTAIQQGNFAYRIRTRSRDQLEAMAASFNKMSESIVSLMQQVSEKQRLDKEIEIAREVQSKLFPQKLPSFKNFQLAAACLPARQVSGDYYDFIPLGANAFDVVIGDISGKGISAALLMASLQSSIRTIISYQTLGANRDASVAKSVSDVNRQLYHQTSPDKFATLVLSRFDAEKLTVTYCNAGHNPPLVISDHTIRHLSKGGMVAGLFEDPEYDEETLQLERDDMVVYYTDGIVEAENPSGEQYGEDRLAELLIANAFLTADDLQALILDQLSCWVAGGDQRDDMTVVIVKMPG